MPKFKITEYFNATKELIVTAANLEKALEDFSDDVADDEEGGLPRLKVTIELIPE